METQQPEQDRCPVCEVGHLVEKVIDKVVEYEDQTATVPNYKLHECNTCGEAIADQESVERLEPVMLDLVAKASTSLIQS